MKPRLVAVKRHDARLSPAEVEAVLRRAAQLSSRREISPSVSPEVLVQVASAVGIREEDVRRAISDLASERAAEPESFAFTLYGSSQLRVVRELERPAEEVRASLEELLRGDQGLKLRRRTGAGSLWDSGDLLGAIRRTLDFSGRRPLLKAKSIEFRVRRLEEERCEALLTADVANQRGEYLSLGGIVAATLALPVAIAGVQDPLFFLGVPPALTVPGLGFRLAYHKSCADIRRTLDELLDAAEGPSEQEPPRERRPLRHVRNLEPIPRFTVPDRKK